MHPGSLYYLQHLGSCAASNAQGGPALHGCSGESYWFPSYGFGLEGLVVFSMAVLNFLLRWGYGTWSGVDVALLAFTGFGTLSLNPLWVSLPVAALAPRISQGLNYAAWQSSHFELANAWSSYLSLMSSLPLGMSSSTELDCGNESGACGGANQTFALNISSGLPGAAYPLAVWDPAGGLSLSLDVAYAVLCICAAAVPTGIYFMMCKAYPNQQGPARLSKMRAYFNASDVLIWVSFTILLQLALGSRTSCALWSVCTGCYLRARNYHGPKVICALTTFFVWFGVGQFFLPNFHLTSLSVLAAVVAACCAVCWPLGWLPYGRKEDEYNQKAGAVRPGAIIAARPSRARGDVVGKVTEVGSVRGGGLKLKIEVTAGPEGFIAKVPLGTILKVHLCPPRGATAGPCPAFKGQSDVYHISSDRWRVEQEAGAGDGDIGATRAAQRAISDGVASDPPPPSQPATASRSPKPRVATKKAAARRKKKTTSPARLDLAEGESVVSSSAE